MVGETGKRWVTVVVLSVLVGACVTYTGTKSGHVDRGQAALWVAQPAEQRSGRAEVEFDALAGAPEKPGQIRLQLCCGVHLARVMSRNWLYL